MKTASHNDTLRVVKALIVDTLLVDPEDIKPGSKLEEDLGADAVDVEELFVAIERELGIEISHEAAERLKTVRHIVDYIDDESESE